METGLKHFHSFFAYAVLLLVAVAVINAILARNNGKRPFAGNGRKLALFGLIAAHVQLLFGIALYLHSPVGLHSFSGANMGNSMARLYMLEHPLMMIIGVVLITMGWSKAKKAADDRGKYGAVALWYGIGLVLLLSRIPWAVWPVGA
ncbi:MAG: hypothetical protein KBH07_00295 [Flavobacteriales bacterium]|nr:hypothetical protein [Flavobacteriales bacterium]MBP9080847.1 hypothetical protein [Flavobacteriales bacterium]